MHLTLKKILYRTIDVIAVLISCGLLALLCIFMYMAYFGNQGFFWFMIVMFASVGTGLWWYYREAHDYDD